MTLNQLSILLVCGIAFARIAKSQSLDRMDNRALENGVTASLDHSVVNGLSATVDAAAGSSGLKSSGESYNFQSDREKSMDFQSSGKINYFRYTEGGSVEMSSSSGELTAAAREARIAANLARQNSSAPNPVPAHNSTSLSFSVTRNGRSSVSSVPTAGIVPGSARKDATALSLVVKANNGPALLKIPLGAKSGLGGSTAKHALLGTHSSGFTTWTSASSKTNPHAFGAGHVGSAPGSSASPRARRARDSVLNPYGNSSGSEVFGSFSKSVIP